MFETKPDPQIESLKKQIQDLIDINKALLNRVRNVDEKLTALAVFVSKNSGDMPCVG